MQYGPVAVNLFSSYFSRMLLRSIVLTVGLRPVNEMLGSAVMQEPADFVSRTEKFVRKQITVLGHDASHDWR